MGDAGWQGQVAQRADCFLSCCVGIDCVRYIDKDYLTERSPLDPRENASACLALFSQNLQTPSEALSFQYLRIYTAKPLSATVLSSKNCWEALLTAMVVSV